MTIKDFYHKLGNTSLNISFYFIFATLFVFFFIFKMAFFSGIVLFIALSLLYFLLHIYYLRRAVQIPGIQFEDDSYTNHRLIEQDQYYLYFFRPNGVVSTSIRVKKRISNFFLEIQSDELDTKNLILTAVKEGEYLICNSDCTAFGQIWLQKKGRFGGIVYKENQIHFIKNINNEVIFYKNKQEIARLRKGWMPLPWVHLFRLNTPVISFFERISKIEREAIYIIIRCIL